MSITCRAAVLSIFLALNVSASAFAQGALAGATIDVNAIDALTPPLHSAGARKAADAISWGTDITVMAFDVVATARASCRGDRAACQRALILTGVRYGTVYGATYGLKKAFARTRPCAPADCGSDNPDFSFPSGHAASAFATVGGPSIYVALPLAITTGGLRIAAGKHWFTDTLAGAGIGLLASRIR